MANRGFIGPFSGGDYRFRISRPSYDVTSPSLDATQLAFDSAWADMSQVVYSGAAAPSGGWFNVGIWTFVPLASFTSLGFLPLCLAWVQGSSGFKATSLGSAALYVTHNSLSVGFNTKDALSFFETVSSWQSQVAAKTFGYAVLKVPVY